MLPKDLIKAVCSWNDFEDRSERFEKIINQEDVVQLMVESSSMFESTNQGTFQLKHQTMHELKDSCNLKSKWGVEPYLNNPKSA